ncbi:histone-lysine N-methyltransferase SUV39H2-like isoform X2 [Phymastichus coffea]|nr:histone-lysine N-methyltransferase SUV39H2-like isoform X2 [Phymastichus coffea]XP_058810066.1 histone-lysine N-methyltransferase SUV39H2-like isoform X2 [Phymastichus coffea]
METNRISKHSDLDMQESLYGQQASRESISNIAEECNKSLPGKNLNRSQSFENESKLLTDSLSKCTKYKEVCIKLEDFQKNRRRDRKASKCENIYEVEKFLGKKSENNNIFYLIKWKNWSPEFSTWEPVHNLTNCAELLKEFEEGRLKSLDMFQKHTNFYPNLITIEKHMQDILSSGNVIDSSLANTDYLYEKINEFFNANPSKRKQLVDNIKEHILHMLVYNARAEQLASLAEWENEMNSITAGKPLIKVENVVDLERAPPEFLYIDDYLPGLNVIIPEEPPIGCECSTCDSKSKCCYAMCDGSFPYTSACRIRVPPGTPIYECNKRCTCSEKCPNRVVQRGSQMKLCVFRTNNGRGWGVKTSRIIKKGTFVIQYVGEVITNEEAERRGKKYDAAGRTYLFDLDYNETEEQCPYTVDAAIYGNVSHFINHSCDPNLAVYAVWINCLDPNLPKLALFATRDIKQNEEITFDYTCQTNKDDPFRCRIGLKGKSSNENTIDGRIRCKCGANNCRQYLF